MPVAKSDHYSGGLVTVPKIYLSGELVTTENDGRFVMWSALSPADEQV